MARLFRSLSPWVVFFYTCLLVSLPFFMGSASADSDVENYGTGKYYLNFIRTLIPGFNGLGSNLQQQVFLDSADLRSLREVSSEMR
jgi:hypothetical protein